MNIVSWNEEVTPILKDRDRKQKFTAMLQREIVGAWSGTVLRKDRIKDDMYPPFVQIRKTLGESQVLIQYGIERSNQSTWRSNSKSPDPVILMSMNGKATLSEDDFIELSLATAEARGVYDAIQK